MSLVRYGQGIIEIKGSMGGVHFKRDLSGNHCSAQNRRICRRTAAQDKQRKAFSKARAYSTDPRTVSYNIYRALNNLSMREPPIDYQIPKLQGP